MWGGLVMAWGPGGNPLSVTLEPPSVCSSRISRAVHPIYFTLAGCFAGVSTECRVEVGAVWIHGSFDLHQFVTHLRTALGAGVGGGEGGGASRPCSTLQFTSAAGNADVPNLIQQSARSEGVRLSHAPHLTTQSAAIPPSAEQWGRSEKTPR